MFQGSSLVGEETQGVANGELYTGMGGSHRFCTNPLQRLEIRVEDVVACYVYRESMGDELTVSCGQILAAVEMREFGCHGMKGRS